MDLVAAVHREGVVIRDLTPANVLVRDDGELRLIDLELAGVPAEDVVPGGSPGYAAPEQWTARRTTTAADLHSLGWSCSPWRPAPNRCSWRTDATPATGSPAGWPAPPATTRRPPSSHR